MALFMLSFKVFCSTFGFSFMIKCSDMDHPSLLDVRSMFSQGSHVHTSSSEHLIFLINFPDSTLFNVLLLLFVI